VSEGQFWLDLQEDLKDPEFKAAYEEASQTINEQLRKENDE
jgi:hypothetical protein